MQVAFTAHQLNKLEELAFSTGLRGSALEVKFLEQENAPVAPLWDGNKRRLRQYFLDVYNAIRDSQVYLRQCVAEKDFPTFEAWMGDEGMREIEAYEK